MVEPPPGTGGVFQVCVGGANGAIPLTDLEGFKGICGSRSAGKGPTLAQARASALAESLERYSTEYTGSEYRVVGTCRELAGRAIHPNAVMGYSERQFRERDAWNARRSRFNMVPAALDPDLPIPWSPVWSLTEERERLLPTQLLYFPGPAAAPGPRPGCCRACSNGNAAGNNLEEAVLQGFMELVERDATAIWWYNRLRRPAVDLDSFGLPYLAGPGRPLRRPGPGPVGPGPHPRPGHPRLRGGVLRRAGPGPGPVRPGLQPGSLRGPGARRSRN